MSLFRKGFGKYLASGTFSDLILKTAYDEHKVHRLVLAYSSEFFARLLLGEFKEASQAKIELKFPDSAKVFPLVLKYMYVGQLQLTLDNVIPLYCMADHYLIPSLKKLTAEYIEEKLSRQTVLALLRNAVFHSVVSIVQKALLVLAKNFCHIGVEVDYSFLPFTLFSSLVFHRYLAVRDEWEVYLVVNKYIEAKKVKALRGRRREKEGAEEEGSERRKDDEVREWKEARRERKGDKKKEEELEESGEGEEEEDELKEGEREKLMSAVRFRFLSFEQLLEAQRNSHVSQRLLVEALLVRLRRHEGLPLTLSPRDKLTSHQKADGKVKKKVKKQKLPIAKAKAKAGNFKYASTSCLPSTASFPTSLPSPKSSVAQEAVHDGRESKEEREKEREEIAGESQASEDSREAGAERREESECTEERTIDGRERGEEDEEDEEEEEEEDEDEDEEQLGRRLSYGIQFEYEHDFDDKGILYWIATDCKRANWCNPHGVKGVTVAASSIEKGKASDLLSRVPATELWTKDVPASWFSIDLGAKRAIVPHYYTLRHGGNYKADFLRTWDLQGSLDGSQWVTLRRHSNDRALNTQYALHTWRITGVSTAYRFFRILQTGHNSNNRNFLVLSGVEFYGELYEVKRI